MDSLSLTNPSNICDGFRVQFSEAMASFEKATVTVVGSNDLGSSAFLYDEDLDSSAGRDPTEFNLNFKGESICKILDPDMRVTKATVHIVKAIDLNDGPAIAGDESHPLEQVFETKWWIIPGVPLDQDLDRPLSASVSEQPPVDSVRYVRLSWSYPSETIRAVDRFVVSMPDHPTR